MATLYYITKRDSETGKKFQLIKDKIIVCKNAQKEFAAKYGFTKWRDSVWDYYGGISRCMRFILPPDLTVWEPSSNDGEYFPNKSSIAGQAILAEIRRLPVVNSDEVNKCIGFSGWPIFSIGVNLNDDTYFGFSLMDDWGVEIPDDCEEVTRDTAKELFMCGIDALDAVSIEPSFEVDEPMNSGLPF